jgi:hypothetical protein
MKVKLLIALVIIGLIAGPVIWREVTRKRGRKPADRSDTRWTQTGFGYPEFDPW